MAKLAGKSKEISNQCKGKTCNNEMLQCFNCRHYIHYECTDSENTESG